MHVTRAWYYIELIYGGGAMNTAKDRIKKLIDEIPESKAGEIIDFLLYLKTKPEQDLYLTPEEEKIIWDKIKNDERIDSNEAKELLIGEVDE